MDEFKEDSEDDGEEWGDDEDDEDVCDMISVASQYSRPANTTLVSSLWMTVGGGTLRWSGCGMMVITDSWQLLSPVGPSSVGTLFLLLLEVSMSTGSSSSEVLLLLGVCVGLS